MKYHFKAAIKKVHTSFEVQTYSYNYILAIDDD